MWYERKGRWLGQSRLCDILIDRIDNGEKTSKEVLLIIKNTAEICLHR